MHDAALDWVRQFAPEHAVFGLDIGGRDINGSATTAFHPDSWWEVVDLQDGPRVTHVGDFMHYRHGELFDAAVCCEVAEHTPDWPRMLARAAGMLHPRHGVLIFTAAGPTREPHSAHDGGPLRVGEHYENLNARRLEDVFARLPFTTVVVDTTPDRADVRAAAWR